MFQYYGVWNSVYIPAQIPRCVTESKNPLGAVSILMRKTIQLMATSSSSTNFITDQPYVTENNGSNGSFLQ